MDTRTRIIFFVVAILAILLMLSGCSAVSSIEPNGDGGWRITLTASWRGSSSMLPKAPTTQPAKE